MIRAFSVLFLVIIVGTTGQILIKYGFLLNSEYTGSLFSVEGIKHILDNPYLVGGILLAGVNFLLWLVVLRIFELGYAFNMTSLQYVLVLAGSYYFLRESITMSKIAGVVLIVLGVILLTWGEADVLKKNLGKDNTPPIVMKQKK